MITLALLLVQTPVALSLLQVRELSPAVAGDAILRDQQHGPIETFEAPTGGMNAPGMIDGELVERPTVSGSGCVRRRWTVKFRAAPGADISTATVEGTYSTQEISLSANGICPSGQYVHLNPGVGVDQGWEALASLKKIRAEANRAHFQCSDATSSALCKDSKSISLALRALTPWAITRDADNIAIWLGIPGNVVTEVRFNVLELSEVVVARRVPAPF